MQFFNNTWVVGIVCSIVSALVAPVYRHLVDRYRERRGALTGTWHQEIYGDDGTTVVKKDFVKCKHIGSKVSGTVKRLEPTSEIYKTWHFRGEVRGKHLFTIYWTDDASKNPGSYGTMQLYITHEALLQGFYTRELETINGQLHATKLASIPSRWVRVN